MTAHLTQESARSLVDAGYMPLSEYIELCKRNGWKEEDSMTVTCEKCHGHGGLHANGCEDRQAPSVNSHDQLLSDKAALEQENARLREALEQIASCRAESDRFKFFARCTADAALARSALKGA